MEGQRQRTGGGGGRRRRRKKKSEANKPKVEPVMIVARRPDSPRMMKATGRSIAASAKPKAAGLNKKESDDSAVAPDPVAKPRRAARILATSTSQLTEDEMRSERLLERLRLGDGRSAITQCADALFESEIAIPEEQELQLQLLEHNDERRALHAVEVLTRLLDEDEPVRRPILDLRLRRLEDEAEDSALRELAAELRRAIRLT